MEAKPTPVVVMSVSEALKAVNLSQYQKHPHFHILRFKDHFNEMPHQIAMQSDGIFEVTASRNDKTNLKFDGTDLNSFKDHLFFLAPGQSVEVDVQSDGDNTNGFMVLFSSDFLNFASSNFSIIQCFPFFSMHYSPIYFMNQTQSTLFHGYMEKIYTEFQDFGEHNIEIIRSLLTVILFEAKRSLDAAQFKNTIRTRAEEITFLFENLLKNAKQVKRKLGYFADQLNISTVYLSECIKKTTGKPAKKIITQYLILEAKSLLEHSPNTIDQIADHLGFEDTSNFIHFFKKNTGYTPSQYRKTVPDS